MSTLDEDIARLREAWRDLAYQLAKALGLITLIRRLGMEPKAWVRERERR